MTTLLSTLQNEAKKSIRINKMRLTKKCPIIQILLACDW